MCGRSKLLFLRYTFDQTFRSGKQQTAQAVAQKIPPISGRSQDNAQGCAAEIQSVGQTQPLPGFRCQGNAEHRQRRVQLWENRPCQAAQQHRYQHIPHIGADEIIVYKQGDADLDCQYQPKDTQIP